MKQGAIGILFPKYPAYAYFSRSEKMTIKLAAFVVYTFLTITPEANEVTTDELAADELAFRGLALTLPSISGELPIFGLPQEEELTEEIVTQDVLMQLDNNPSAVNEFTQWEKDLLASLVYAEARGEEYEGKVAVAEVVLNRIESEKFPDTLEGVIFQRRQFTPVDNGAINNNADEESRRAVEEALHKDRANGLGSLFFYNSKTATNRWLDTRETTKVIGNHTFKK